MPPANNLLLFGATGAIGNSILRLTASRGWSITAVARSLPVQTADLIDHVHHTTFDPFLPDAGFGLIALDAPYTAVCWAQGANLNDSVYTADPDQHLDLYRANCLYILVTLKALLEQNLLAPASRLCVISSIWQNLTRQSKLSYCMTKAALQGLVLSASADLAADGHLINAVLPGALDTPMTHRNLTPEQIDRLTAATNFGRLPSLSDVASLVCFLCGSENTGITGQFIAADLGFSHVRIV